MSGEHRGGPRGRGRRQRGRVAPGPRASRLGPLRSLGVLVVGVAACALSTPAASPVGASTTSVGGRSPSPVSSASTSSRGVSAHAVDVVFPVVSLNSLAGQEGFAQDAEFGEQAKAIRFFVQRINASGGIDGRRIVPVITSFDPTDESQMRALCKTWTEGSPAAFAVVDGLGDWTGDDQLCITQEGHTPFIGAWTTVTDWTDEGSPYLWWTGPDQAAVLQGVVDWGLGSHLIGGSVTVGVIAGNRASDQAALDDYLLPDLRRAGVTPVVKTIDASPDDTATTDTQAPLVVQQLRSAGVTSVIPLMPFNDFYPVLQAETSQQYFPKLLLSDYESSIETALGLLLAPYSKALNGQEGLTTETLGGIDDDRPQSQGGYDPGVRACWIPWHQAYPEAPPGNMNDFIEEQGPVVGWCQAISLFATAARRAGHDLNRRTFVTALSKITDFPGTWSPVLSFGQDKRYGPTRYQVVELHINTTSGPQCHHGAGHPPEPACWLQVQPWAPLPGT